MLGVVKRMSVTITCDHRHIYGADAARFLDALAKVLEGDINVLLK
jgi:pyruvate dehydrogenase E2 component (dihydrolipoamide acetyltransferase)